MVDTKTTEFTIKDYSRTFGVSDSKIRKDIRAGIIKAKKNGGVWTIFAESDTIPETSSENVLIRAKDDQIQMLQEQLEFLQKTLEQTIQDHAKETDQFQQVILNQSLLLENGKSGGLFQKLRNVFRFNREVI